SCGRSIQPACSLFAGPRAVVQPPLRQSTAASAGCSSNGRSDRICGATSSWTSRRPAFVAQSHSSSINMSDRLTDLPATAALGIREPMLAASADWPGSGVPVRRFDGLRVLVVEDEYLVALLLEEDLRSAGCIVLGSHTSLAAATAAARDQSIDLAVLDVNLN